MTASQQSIDLDVGKHELKNFLSHPLCNPVHSYGRAIIINFNNKFKFIVDEKLVTQKSGVLKQLIEGDQKRIEYTLNLPHLHFLEPIVVYLKVGIISGITNDMFSYLFTNCEYLGLDEILFELQVQFDANCLEISLMDNFNDKNIPQTLFHRIMMNSYPKNYRIHCKSKKMCASDHVKVLKLWMDRHPKTCESWIGKILFEMLCSENPRMWV